MKLEFMHTVIVCSSFSSGHEYGNCRSNTVKKHVASPSSRAMIGFVTNFDAFVVKVLVSDTSVGIERWVKTC